MLLSVPLVAAGVWRPELAYVGWGWSLAILLVAVADHLVSRRLIVLEVERRVEERLSVGVENPVIVRVRNRCRWPLRLIIKDDVPTEFTCSGRVQSLSVLPYQQGQVRYYVAPSRRGDFAFGDIFVRGVSLAGLTWWQRRFAAAQAVKVYPNIVALRRYELLAHSNKLHRAGFHALQRLGEGTQFESLRDYVPDDDFRDIDWKATARRHKPTTRQYTVERSQNVVLMIDAGRMMAAEVNGLCKLDYAINAAVLLARAAVDKGDAVGLIAFSEQILAFSPPRSAADQVSHILDQLYAVTPSLQEADYQAAFSLLYSRARKRALVVVFTDLVDAKASEQLLAYVAALLPRHLPMFVTLRDSNLEAVATAVPDDPHHAYARAVAGNLVDRRREALLSLQQSGALVVDAFPDRLTVATVNRYLQLKAYGRL